MSFVHLHSHTEYSLLDSSNKVKEYVAKVKELGMNAAAITDHGVMYGVIEFYKAAKAAGIKPILGCEVYVAPKSRHEKSAGGERYNHLVLLAENNTGYRNLIKLVSRGFTEGFYYKPRVDMELLEEYHEGIIALSACLAGKVQRLLLNNDYEGAKEAALAYEECFGKGNFFLELQDHGIADQRRVNPLLVRLHNETGIDLVVTNDIHYTSREDSYPHDILLCLQSKKKLTDTDRMKYEGDQFYVKSEEEMRRLFPSLPEAFDNTQKIADRCDVEIKFHEYKIPHYDCPDGMNAEEYLYKVASEGFYKRYPDPDDALKERFEYEYNTIKDMGFADYFLIVWDFIRYARSQGIPIGPGRGSAAGSVVSYSLGITQLDPIKYSLIFERFLNPERVSMPDIDVDICYSRRQEVIDYVIKKYGRENVSQISTLSTMGAKSVIRDVGRVLGLDYAFCDNISKMIPKDVETIAEAEEVEPKLRNLDDVGNELIKLSKRLEGLPRHMSIHAAGVLISQSAVDDHVPLVKTKDGIATQFDMTTIEELGQLKMDFLGLRTLTVIQNTLDAANTGMNASDIPYDSPEVYELISSGKTTGVFQLESKGMQSFMQELQPSCFEDVIAGISLYRPGPMEFIPQYIENKRNPQNITYDCPQLEPILAPTYGCIVYQEAVMQIVRDLAGYSMGRSDLVRRAMSKKKEDVMARERENFVNGNPEENVPGCVNNGISKEIANKVFDEMTDFAKYAFNKSHAAAYAVVACQTAWLKVHYPAEFMAALLTSVLEKSDKLALYTAECKRMHIRMIQPNINTGSGAFSATENGEIHYALSAVKNVSTNLMQSVAEVREEGGPFVSLRDFITRCPMVNKLALENLVKCGAFDKLYPNRKAVLKQIPIIIESQKNKKTIPGQISLFETTPETDTMPNIPDFTEQERLDMEHEIIGSYVSGHPLEKRKIQWEKTITKNGLDFSDKEHMIEGNSEVIGGVITECEIKRTKAGKKPMAFITIEDLYGSIPVVVFPKVYERYGDLFYEGNTLYIRGRVSLGDNGALNLAADKIIPLDAARATVYVKFENMEIFQKEYEDFYNLLRSNIGVNPVLAYIDQEKLLYDMKLSISPRAINELRYKYGETNIGEKEEAVLI